MIGVCIVAFIKLRTGRDRMTAENDVTDHDKGSAEPLQRNMGSHSSLEEKNPDVVPQENSEDEEKAFDRLKFDTQRIVYTPGISVSPPPPLSPTSYTKSVSFLYHKLKKRTMMNKYKTILYLFEVNDSHCFAFI